MSIPKKIFTIWLNDNPVIPERFRRCIETHKIDGYEHKLVTVNEIPQNEYIAGCLLNKNWVKAADYLRILLLYMYGGIYLDADVELRKPFGLMHEHRLFCGVEKKRWIANSVIGAEQGHPLLKEYLDRVDRNFKGTGDLVYEAGQGIWHNLLLAANQQEHGIRIYEPEYFFPYDKDSNSMTATDNTVAVHLFANSWV